MPQPRWAKLPGPPLSDVWLAGIIAKRFGNEMTIEELRAELDERRTAARQDAHESIKVAPNSYGAGYDTGYLKALEEILKFVNGESE